MIHKIKALYDEGNGLSIRAIAEELNVSRNVTDHSAAFLTPTECTEC